MSKVWAISTDKGGVLKTSVTTNTAGVLSKSKRVLIIDTDRQGNCMLNFGQNPHKLEITLFDVLAGEASVDSAIVNVHENIDILPANRDMNVLEFNVIQNPQKFPKPFGLMKKTLDPLREQYDVILVDTPASSGLIQGNVMAFVDKVIIPFQPENNSRLALADIVNDIKSFKSINSNLSIMGILGTLVDMRTRLHRDVIADCEKFCEQNGLHFFKTKIPRSIRFATSEAYEQLPSTLTETRNPVVQLYFDFVQEVERIDQKI